MKGRKCQSGLAVWSEMSARGLGQKENALCAHIPQHTFEARGPSDAWVPIADVTENTIESGAD